MAEPKRKRLVVLAALGGVLLVGGGVAGGYVLTQPASAATAPEAEKLVPGEVVALDPVSVNLAANHYLKVGVALQAVASKAKGEGGASGPDGSKALDLTIKEFSGRTFEELSNREVRQKLQDELQEKIVAAYEVESEKKGEAPSKTVMSIYITDFVMQ